MKKYADFPIELISLPPEQLKTMLQEETRKPVPDDNLVLTILHILDEQDAGKPVVLNDREKAAWRKYQTSAIRRGKPLQPVFRAVASLAASLALILALMVSQLPQEASAGGIFDVFTKYSDKILEFFSFRLDESIMPEYEFRTDHPGLQKLHDTLVKYGYDGPAVPMWIPAEYNELLRIETDKATMCNTITATFSNGNQELIISISVFSTAVPQGYYKNALDAKELEIYGTIHYLLQNREKCTATWTEDNIAGCIALDCQENVLREILKTIYAMEAQ